MTADRYVAWLSRRGKAIVIASGLAVAAAAYLVAFHLPLRAAFTYLLPADAPSVRAFDELARRMPARDTMLAIVVAPDAASREAAAEQMIAGARAIEPDLVDHVETDDAASQAFFRAHRHLYAAVPDLVAARDALAKHIAGAKMRANPLYIDLDDDKPPPDPAIADLRAKQRAAEAKLAKSTFVTADGRAQVVIIRTAFNATDVDRDHRLQRRLDDLAAGVHACFPLVQIGFTGGITNTVAEHNALVHGVLLSTLITCTLVALVLFVHLRDVRMLGLVVANITAATLVGFGIAALSVGHLNAATAFLGAIVAGNGINYGILLVARYREERRSAEPAAAMARAIARTLRPTLVASLGAAIAYGALGATKFRGFADFALIGGVGMIVCWVASFVLLPVLVLRLAPTPKRPVSSLFGKLVVRLFGFRRAGLVCAGSALVVIAAGVVSWRYLANDPYEYDLEELRSQAPDAVVARDWLKFADRTFQRGLAGLAGDTYVLLDDERDAAPVVTALRDLATRDPIVGSVASILDAVPADQPRRLELLAEIRRQIDDALPSLDGRQRDDVLALRPPDALAPITARDLPRDLVAKLTERDGRIGYVVAVKPGADFDETDGRDMIHFADAVRQVHVRGEPVTAAGGSLLFADVLLQIRHDGPLVSALAAAGLVAMVLLVVGRTRRATAVLASTAAGSLAMIAACALAGLKIDFLDFVALPITLGLGIDYAINMADRAGERGGDHPPHRLRRCCAPDVRRACDPLAALRSTGGTVFVCSLTTIIGYTSLLVSDNRAIRGFGLASLIGEITCVVAALVVVPAVIAYRCRREIAPHHRPGRGAELMAPP